MASPGEVKILQEALKELVDAIMPLRVNGTLAINLDTKLKAAIVRANYILIHP